MEIKKREFEQTKRKKTPTPTGARRERKPYFIVVKSTQGTNMFNLVIADIFAEKIHMVLSRAGY